MRAALDTVVVLRALMNPTGTWARVFFELRSKYELVVSPDTVRELTGVVRRPELSDRLPPVESLVWRDMVEILADATMVEPDFSLDICRDPKDNKFFECAVTASADYIVSEDRDILDVGEYAGIRTVTAAEFIGLLEAN